MSHHRAKEIDGIVRSQVQGLERRAARIVGEAEAPDVVQDLFTRIWERARDHVTLTPAYLARALRNVAIDHLRHERQHQNLRWLLTEAQYATPAPSPEQILIAADELRRVEAALRIMPDRRRRIFLLNRNLGCSYAEIAEAMEISYSTVEREIARALATCREAMGPEA